MAIKTRNARSRGAGIKPDPLWFKTAVIYEVHVRAFYDANGDGVGDLPGLISKLDYLEDLGVTALWLLPFYPSPLRDGGYDIADYTAINPAYGTMDDFRRLLDEAHRRGLRIITELVLNHTSADHAWFQRARTAPPGSPERDFYVWSETPQRYQSSRIIFKDFETSNWSWDPVAGAYYWHRFYAHQPDLNFENPAVRGAMLEVVDFWLGLGVDGLRLDAVPYLYEGEGTSCENLDETHAFLRELRAHVDARFTDRMLLAEANQWPSEAAAYFGRGDECHMNFHFPLMPRMFMALQMEDSFPIVDILRQTPPAPPNCQWATFLRNHDELTLEMVTDEERDYMYHAYTDDPTARINLGIRRRLAPLLRSRRKVELMKGLLLALPGTPVLYYGDEIGMGDNMYLGDRDGVRTPMHWSPDRNAGFSQANPQRLYLPVIVDPEYHYEAINVDAQEQNPSSLLWWTKRLIALRHQHPVFGRGDIEFVRADNPRVFGFVRQHERDAVLVVANLSRYSQHVGLDLSRHAGTSVEEVFGGSQFPTVTDQPYELSLGPHGFYWFRLTRPSGEVTTQVLTAVDAWTDVFTQRDELARSLAAFAAGRRWFRGKARTQRSTRIVDVVELARPTGPIYLTVFEIEYTHGEPESYVVPVAFAAAEHGDHIEQRVPHGVIVRIAISGATPVRGVLYDALVTGEAASAILEALRTGRTSAPGEVGELVFTPAPELADVVGPNAPVPRPTQLEQTNTTVPFGDKVLVKVFRQLEAGVNAELEMGSYLTGAARNLTPSVLGSVTYRPSGGESATLAVTHEFVPNQGPAWDLFLSHLDTLFNQALSARLQAPAPPWAHLLELVGAEPPSSLTEVSGAALRHARRLGVRTGEVHAVLARAKGPAFAAEKFTTMYQQSLFQGARTLLVRTCDGLALRIAELPPESHDDIRTLLATQDAVEERLRRITSRPIAADRIRAHGDLHLGQVLFTGEDFVLIDFEGEPARPLRERRYKRCPLRDAAGMLRSFSYVAESALRAGRQREHDVAALRPWVRAWSAWMGASYLAGYLEVVEPLRIIPTGLDDRRLLLDFYLLDKCVYEVAYELNNRPTWVGIPVRAMVELLEGAHPVPRVTLPDTGR
jgi:maltose alpha-D-glucosyltransferase/alpha-amylase